MKTYFVSTSIPYVNARPHVGHAQEFVLADILARYNRIVGNDVFFLSGTDDNALKNVVKAEEEGMNVEDFVGRNADIFEDLLSKLNVSNDDFIRTSSDERHLGGAQKLWEHFKPEDIIKKKYKGLYCVGCEEFKTTKELKEGECSEHPGKALEEIEEENYFFRLHNYEKKLETLIENNTIKIVPESRKSEVLAFIRGGLEDLSISRSKDRARNWGVPVPDDESQIQYVWVDALSNYINALGYAGEEDQYKKFWTESDARVHVVGKGITRFHAIYWPAFLLSAGITLPTHIFVHGYFTVDGQKMSKSLGNVIDPLDVIEEYGADAFRYFIAREASVFEDSDFTHERFKETYNGNLSNGLGNLTARIMKLAEVYLEEPVSLTPKTSFPETYTRAFDALDFNRATEYIWSEIQKIDERISRETPFKLVKEDPEKGKQAIKELVLELYVIANMLEPFMPQSSMLIKESIKTNNKPEALFVRK